MVYLRECRSLGRYNGHLRLELMASRAMRAVARHDEARRRTVGLPSSCLHPSC